MVRKQKLYLLISLLWCMHMHTLSATPKITIVIVIDQFAYRLLQTLRPYLTGGLGFLLEEGIYYANAHTPYAWPSTGTGSASLNTGTTAKDHGIIADYWYNEVTRTKIACDDDTPERAAVFGSNGLQPYGKSPRHIMVDGISDQLMIQKQQHKNYKVFSISGKSRSAIGTANKLGKAIWFDPQTGMFTSSKAYFDALPTWVQRFNRTIAGRTPYTWHLQHTCMPAAYKFKGLLDCAACKHKQRMIGKTFCPLAGTDNPYKEIEQTPLASQLVFDCAAACLDEHYSSCCDDKLLMWVWPSCLDKLGHTYGPHSQEVVDLVYHVDRQLKLFIDKVNSKTKKRNILWVLTTDHGVAPCPEQMQREGYTQSHRIMENDIITKLNTELAEQFDVKDLILDANAGALSINRQLYRSLDLKKRHDLKRHIIESTERIPGIKKVWTSRDLYKLPTVPESIEQMFKNQLYPQRNSSLIIQTQPYSFITSYSQGTAHHSPYDYDTHIPLVMYRRAYLQRKVIEDRVTNTQLAPTLAYLLGVQRPSACITQILPGIIFKEDCCF
jgi:predicted AlkP superfamily pyrophosphatase or phosphodiesterase